MLKIHIYVFLFVVYSQPSWGFYSEVKEFAGNVFNLIDMVKKASENHKTGEWMIKALSHDGPPNDRIVKKINRMKLYLKNQFELKGNAENILERLGQNVEITPSKMKLADYIETIDTQFRKLMQNIHQPKDMTGTWYDFVLEISLKIRDNIENLRNLLTGLPGDAELKTGLLKSLQEKSYQATNTCGSSVFQIHHLLVDLVRIVIIAEIQTLAVLTLALPILSGDEKWVKKIQYEKKDFKRRVTDYVSTVIDAMKLAPGNLRACDPGSGWVRDETYFEMERFVQQVIFVKQHSSSDLCGDLAYFFNEGMKDGMKFFTEKTTCRGELSDCKQYDGVEGCLSDSYPKRYESIKWDKGSYGRNIDSCPADRRIEQSIQYTDNCACQCFESHNRISLKIIQSDTKINMVITGIRFIRHDNILYLQPQQGKLLKNGRIDSGSQSWIDLPVNAYTENLTLDNNAFFMDDLMVPFGSVVTGVGFVFAAMGETVGFRMQVRGMQFDYSSGKLVGREELIRKPQIGYAFKIKSVPVTYGTENSLYTSGLIHEPDSANKTYVELRQSSLSKEFGQSTVPLFDGVAVESSPPSPLGGIGIFHKGVKRSGTPRYAGFISLRLHALNYWKYLEDFKAIYKSEKA